MKRFLIPKTETDNKSKETEIKWACTNKGPTNNGAMETTCYDCGQELSWVKPHK